MSITSESIEEVSAVAEEESRHPEALRGAMYYLLGRAFSSPLTMDSDLPKTLREVSVEAPGKLQAAAHATADAWEKALQDSEALALAYARYFLGPFEILTPPYASFYLEPDHKLMGDVSLAVAQRYASAGLKPGPGPREVPDHIALEWEFMYYLTQHAISTGDSRWLAERDTFRSGHMCRWVPELSAAMIKEGSDPFYCALAELMEQVIQL